jgi:ubiquinone/menaquinone biosynthesis C-methylase UbiE
MDSAEDAREYDRMDHARVNDAFVDDFLATGFGGGDVLDLGTGTALIPILLCRRHERCRVMAIDLAAAMLDLARLNISLARLSERIQLSQVDAKRMPFPDGMFEATISNSILHHLPQGDACLAEAVRVTRPGGWLFFRDLLRPATESRLLELVETYAGREGSRSQQLFGDSLRAAFTLDEVRDLVAGVGFGPQHVQATSDRHWTFSARKP